ncbi:MAG: flagellar hook capping protein [Candidatus Thiodiazotropha sp. (ex Dulcina madagascariensis)]|nr:flagellar hook capping protein [Candidatus Thiodiazotropha sp. (ex Dulcina madagascariensis)]
MAIDSIGSTSSNTESVLRQAGLGQDDFMKILLTQLTYQDPLSPMDNQEFIAQFAQFSQLEQSRQSNESLDSLFTLQATNQAVNLLGKNVEVASSSGSIVGDVTTVSFRRGVPDITVTTSGGDVITNVSLSQITVIRQ